MHVIDIDYKQDGLTVASDDENGLATTFKIGWGISNQFSLSYVRNASWYRAPFYDGYSVSDGTYAVGISGKEQLFIYRQQPRPAISLALWVLAMHHYLSRTPWIWTQVMRR